jgi:6-phosphogluconolactonase
MAGSSSEKMKPPNFAMAVFDSPETLARGAAEKWVDRLKASPGDTVCAALPGGRIYRLFFQALAKEASKSSGVLDRVHFFWGDERCVSPDDSESNYKMADDLLFRPLGIANENVHRIRGEDDPAAAAADAEAALRSVAPAGPGGLPRLDYIFLGMGEDGHIASLFPGEPAAVVNSPTVYRAVTGPKPPPRRITLGYGTIAAAANVWVLVSGAGKEGALRQSISAGGATPLARVLAQRNDALVLTDFNLRR